MPKNTEGIQVVVMNRRKSVAEDKDKNIFLKITLKYYRPKHSRKGMLPFGWIYHICICDLICNGL